MQEQIKDIIIIIERQSHQIFWITRGTGFTPFGYMFTHRLFVFTPAKKFIHTEIEQFILCGTNITLNLVSSHSNLATWRRIMTPAPHTNDTVTHEETGRNPHSWQKTLLLSRRVLLPGTNTTLVRLPPTPPSSSCPTQVLYNPLWPPWVAVCKILQFWKSGWQVWLIACPKFSSVIPWRGVISNVLPPVSRIKKLQASITDEGDKKWDYRFRFGTTSIVGFFGIE